MINLENKTLYSKFCETTYVPIFSHGWWLDSVCGSENWDVWLYESGGNILAAMPYYRIKKGEFDYITKAPLTQNNGIIFKQNSSIKLPSLAEFQQKIIDNACLWLKNANIDAYEQQYHYSFENWQPFFWKGYECILRYTYVIENTQNMFEVEQGYSSKLRSIIKKGSRNSRIVEIMDANIFYQEHEKVFLKQGLPCPFSYSLWLKIYSSCEKHNCGKILTAKDSNENIHSLAYLVWDEKSVYLLLGGSMPGFSYSDSYSFLIHKSIEMASSMGKSFDFEGSMIARVAKSIRQFGGIPKPYFRIRKIFNKKLLINEQQMKLENFDNEEI